MQDSNSKITVHIVDDHQIIIDGLIAVLAFEDDIEVVGYSLNGKQALDWVQEHSADVLLLDVNMPEVSGIEVLKELKKRQSTPNVIILSSYDEIKLIKEALKLGAKGFVPKKSAGEQIVKAIRDVASGEQYFTEDIKNKIVMAVINKSEPKPVNNSKNLDKGLIDSLTKREYEILKLISQEYSTKKISETLFISTNTVDSHRKNLIKKMNVKNSVGLVLFAIKNKMI